MPPESHRSLMVERQIVARGVRDPAVLAAMRRVPRERFVPPAERDAAFDDTALPIAHGQTISQPYIVAFMTEALRLDGTSRVLEIGTGSGYQAAVLAEIAHEVYSIEIVPELADAAAHLLRELGYHNIQLRTGDGYAGWPEAAPFDAIILTAAPPRVPQPLLDQLKPGGRLVAPVGGGGGQQLVRYTRRAHGFAEDNLLPVRFVPMTGRAQQPAGPSRPR